MTPLGKISLEHASCFTFTVLHGNHPANRSDFNIIKRNDTVWAVEFRGFVLSKTENELVYEPMQSNRSKEFIADTRFNKADEALLALQKFLHSHEYLSGFWQPKEAI